MSETEQEKDARRERVLRAIAEADAARVRYYAADDATIRARREEYDVAMEEIERMERDRNAEGGTRGGNGRRPGIPP